MNKSALALPAAAVLALTLAACTTPWDSEPEPMAQPGAMTQPMGAPVTQPAPIESAPAQPGQDLPPL